MGVVRAISPGGPLLAHPRTVRRKRSGQDEDRGGVRQEAEQSQAGGRRTAPDEQTRKALRGENHEADGQDDDRRLHDEDAVESRAPEDRGRDAVALDMNPEPADTDGKGQGIRQLRQHDAEEDEARVEHRYRPRMQDGGHGSHRLHGPTGACQKRLTAPILRDTNALIRPRCNKPMPQALIVIFLLFFAVLAAGWFYFQRAKARDASKAATGAATTGTPDESQ